MNLMERLVGIWGRPAEEVGEGDWEAQASGGDDLSLTPGLDRQIEEGAGRREGAAEHEEPH